LGVFLTTNSSVVLEGTSLTSFGDRRVELKDVIDTHLEEYVIPDPNNSSYSFVGTPWESPGDVPKDQPIGFMMNDASGLVIPPEWESTSPPSVIHYAQKVASYNDISRASATVMFHPDETETMVMVAARDIKPGEELFYHYGYGYWLRRLILYSRDPRVRLAMLVYQAMTNPQLIEEKTVVLNRQGELVMLHTGKPVSDDSWASIFLEQGLLLPSDGQSLKKYGLSSSMTPTQKLKALGRGLIPTITKR